MLLFTRSSVIAADALVLVVTWTKTFKHWKQLHQMSLGASISTLLLRDGMCKLSLAISCPLVTVDRKYRNSVFYVRCLALILTQETSYM